LTPGAVSRLVDRALESRRGAADQPCRGHHQLRAITGAAPPCLTGELPGPELRIGGPRPARPSQRWMGSTGSSSQRCWSSRMRRGHRRPA
jgi:hypothetical protein